MPDSTMIRTFALRTLRAVKQSVVSDISDGFGVNPTVARESLIETAYMRN
jgi:hypothetical protein